MKNLVMTKMTVEYKYYPLFDAYCHAARGILFCLCGGGFKGGFRKNGQDYVIYNIWPCDYDFMRLMMEEFPF